MADGDNSRGQALPRSWATSELFARVASATSLGAITLAVTNVGG